MRSKSNSERIFFIFCLTNQLVAHCDLHSMHSFVVRCEQQQSKFIRINSIDCMQKTQQMLIQLSILFESECVVLYQTTFQTIFYCFSASLFSKSPNLNLSIDAAKHCKSSIMAFILCACTDILFCTTRLLV